MYTNDDEKEKDGIKESIQGDQVGNKNLKQHENLAK